MDVLSDKVTGSFVVVKNFSLPCINCWFPLTRKVDVCCVYVKDSTEEKKENIIKKVFEFEIPVPGVSRFAPIPLS